MSDSLIIQDLYVYPIKSLAGIRLHEAKVEGRGFEFDRRWMLIDENGQFLSQRTFPQMALLKVEIGRDALKVFHQASPEDFIEIPFEEDSQEILSVTVWDDDMDATLVNSRFDTWFSQVLGLSARLVKMPHATNRKVDPRYAINEESVSFADGMPYLLIGQNSLENLNSRLDYPVLMDRFRPNIVFSGGEAFAEDSWKKIKIGKVDFQVVKPCARCVMITVEQNTGKKGAEPLKTLAGYRKVGNKIMFGQNMVALSTGVIKVGDEIKLV
ncbi:MOSC domain-containing protein [Algoriphagus yeomjeoni]|uniref:MOSC domain-containing protein n=1 Tax=Algoriphagus yeomjeoni TaxID=291403 RepID=A0A327PKY5_9BACT|nr:MOSC N-terminal beta barrel domain-containing protein [Algoriphagus yeomjeoni]RAI91914.1 hypothetical protein LV83_01139 [Algoriphagus yeomjeoni]